MLFSAISCSNTVAHPPPPVNTSSHPSIRNSQCIPTQPLTDKTTQAHKNPVKSRDWIHITRQTTWSTNPPLVCILNAWLLHPLLVCILNGCCTLYWYASSMAVAPSTGMHPQCMAVAHGNSIPCMHPILMKAKRRCETCVKTWHVSWPYRFLLSKKTFEHAVWEWCLRVWRPPLRNFVRDLNLKWSSGWSFVGGGCAEWPHHVTSFTWNHFNFSTALTLFSRAVSWVPMKISGD